MLLVCRVLWRSGWWDAGMVAEGLQLGSDSACLNM